MRIDLKRSFSVAGDSAEDTEDWLRYFRKGQGELSWSDLHDKPIVVVVGEAGIGKTVEFENQVARLQHEGKFALFVPLNQMLNNESWFRTLKSSASDYAGWEISSDVGYFFFDAVDEARLISHAYFQTALSVISSGLRDNMSRVRIVISSRITDWAVGDVKDAVRMYFVIPIEAALRTTGVTQASTAYSRTGDVVQMPKVTATERLDPFAVSLDPLSRTEAERLADAFQILNAREFWAAVDDGDYQFMATRPLDLEWMVSLWNEKHSLGTYTQLIESNISNRLKDANSNYQTTGAVLSADRLRDGAEQLAAATEFSGRPFLSTSISGVTKTNEIAPASMLSGWKPIEVSRLLASAIFDIATFGRVKFHHRSVREYLAASWVNRQLELGVPFHRVLPLFSASPFGSLVLIPAHRTALCWLAALNVEVREWVMRHFPEMLLFEGDPEAWDTIAVDEAFLAYVERLKAGLHTDWYNDPSELRRVGRRLPPGRVASLLATQPTDSNLMGSLLPLVTHGRLMDCADAIFSIYRNPASLPHEQHYALIALATVASAQQRTAVRDDLLAGRLASNELIASALSVIDWGMLRAEDLITVFQVTDSESEYGGPMARAIKEELLPATDINSAQLLLAAVIAALPAPEPGRRFTRFPESEQSQRTWLLDVLPNCLERVLTLLPKPPDSIPEVCLNAAERVETFRDSRFIDRDELVRLRSLIADYPALRWQVAFEIIQSEDIQVSTSRLIWDSNCLISFGADDLPALTMRANNEALAKDIRGIWFKVGMNLAFGRLKGRRRAEVLRELVSGPDGELRATQIIAVTTELIAGAKERRQWQRRDRQRKLEKRVEHQHSRENISSDIEQIRDGTYTGALHWLISYSFQHADQKNFTYVDFEVIAKDFGQVISDALKSGLIEAWSKAGTPNPTDYANNSRPWEAITGLAGLHTLLANGVDIASLSEDDAARAAKLAVWKLNGPPSWFEKLFLTHQHAVCAALHPWIVAEAVAATDANPVRGALYLSLRCTPTVRKHLLQPLVPLILDGLMCNSPTLESVLKALREGDRISTDVVAGICHDKVTGTLNSDGLISEMGWMQTWLEEAPILAWEWLETHLDSLGAAANTQIHEFATAIADTNWVKMLTSDGGIGVLLRMHDFLVPCLPQLATSYANEEGNVFRHPIVRLRDKIPQVLVQTRGQAANKALVTLAAKQIDQQASRWLNSLVLEHAAREAQDAAQFEIPVLKAIASPFLTTPKAKPSCFSRLSHGWRKSD